jgi:hypothetical protein
MVNATKKKGESMHEMTVKLELQEELLGTSSANPDLYRDYIASKNPKGVAQDEIDNLAEMVADVDEELDLSTTVFHRKDGKPFLYDYQVKGFFKDACGCLRRADETLSKKEKAYKKVIDGLVFIKEREIFPELSGDMGVCERPLRAQTPQGERIALARSEAMPAGSVMTFTIVMLDKKLKKLVKEWLDYGRFRGLGQWRNSGKGRFTYELLSESSGEDA